MRGPESFPPEEHIEQMDTMEAAADHIKRVEEGIFGNPGDTFNDNDPISFLS